MPAGALQKANHRPLVAAARQREHPADRGRGTVNVIGDAMRSAHDHQNHHSPSLPQPTYTFSSRALADGFTTYTLGTRPCGAMSQASSPR